VAFKIARFGTVDYRMCEILQENVYKHASLIWTYRRCHWRMAAAMTTWSSLVRSILSRCFSSPDQWWVFWTPLAIFPTLCNQLDSNLAKFGGHS